MSVALQSKLARLHNWHTRYEVTAVHKASARIIVAESRAMAERRGR